MPPIRTRSPRSSGRTRLRCVPPATVLALATLTACSDPATEEFKQAFKQFDAAGDRGDWSTVLAMIDERSLPHQELVLRRARTATFDDLTNLPLGDRFDVIMLRQVLTPEQLRTCTAEESIRATVEAGLWASSDEDDKAWYGKVKVKGDYATVQLLDIHSKPTGDHETWRRVNRVWKIDLASGNEASTIRLEQLWEEHRISPKDLIEYIVAERTQREVAPDIWEPKGK